jgi:VIT1/CCC1 family predicted Fe2+/Mn2+ transporter
MDYNHKHKVHRIGWLRAAVMGANDGIVSVASLVIGVAAANAALADIVLAGVAGLVAGAMSMAAGEYVSVSSQADTEKSDIALEKKHLKENPKEEHLELVQIYVERGLERGLATQVATQLMQHAPLEAHLRDELGITDIAVARPFQAAFASALTFIAGGAVSLLPLLFVLREDVVWAVAATTLIALIGLGATAAHAGGANIAVGAARVTFWGVSAMGATAVIGKLVGTVAV